MKFLRNILALIGAAYSFLSFASNPLILAPQLALSVVKTRGIPLCNELSRRFKSHPEIRQTIVNGFSEFQHTAGFLSTLEKIKQQAHNFDALKGYLFEIEKALELQEKAERDTIFTIHGFGQIRKSPKSNKEREFDIIVQNGDTMMYCECKNTHWNMSIDKHCEQFLDQKEIAGDLSSQYRVPIQYVVCSKQPLPDNWQEFFSQHEIMVDVQEK